MNGIGKLSESVQLTLRCPICTSALSAVGAQGELACTNAQGMHRFPIVAGIPILIDESSSVFRIADFVQQRSTTFKPASRVRRVLSGLLPELGETLVTATNYRKLAALLLQRGGRPDVLVIGGSIVGRGMQDILNNPLLRFTETDVSFGPRTALICDAHELPFADSSFDGVIAQAVLEHVVDPYRCVEEIHRVLKEGGLVYAETPFMQQVHMGRYDFTRFTHLGHRRLFRKFEHLASGAGGGPGAALAWSGTYFLLAFVQSKTAIAVVKAFARLTLFWLKYFDRYLIDKPGTLDGAWGYYFLGRRGEGVLSDRELLQLYRGIL
jgi:SAM-dependent methyltransferase